MHRRHCCRLTSRPEGVLTQHIGAEPWKQTRVPSGCPSTSARGRLAPERLEAPAPTPVAQTPAYSWDTQQDAGLTTKVSTDAVVVQVDDITNLQNELEQARAKIREQQVALQTAQDQAPAPPAAPSEPQSKSKMECLS